MSESDTVFVRARQLGADLEEDPKAARELFRRLDFADEALERKIAEHLIAIVGTPKEADLAISSRLNRLDDFSFVVTGVDAVERAAMIARQVIEPRLTVGSKPGIETVRHYKRSYPPVFLHGLGADSNSDVRLELFYSVLLLIFWRSMVLVWAAAELPKVFDEGFSDEEELAMSIIRSLDRDLARMRAIQTSEGRIYGRGHEEVSATKWSGLSPASKVVAGLTGGIWISLGADALLRWVL